MMTDKPPARIGPASQKERKRAERVRKRLAGLVPLDLWVPAERKDELKKVFEAIIDQYRNPKP